MDESIKGEFCVFWYNSDENACHHEIVEEELERKLKAESEKITWLFTQEQLQKLFSTTFPSIDIMERMILDWRWERDYWTIFTSFEQLWLAFVMKERHRRIWNQQLEEWVEASR